MLSLLVSWWMEGRRPGAGEAATPSRLPWFSPGGGEGVVFWPAVKAARGQFDRGADTGRDGDLEAQCVSLESP